MTDPEGTIVHLSEPVKAVADGLSLVTVLGALAAWLPPIAALVSIVWTVIRIGESETFQKWYRKRKRAAQAKKITINIEKCQHCGDTVKGGL